MTSVATMFTADCRLRRQRVRRGAVVCVLAALVAMATAPADGQGAAPAPSTSAPGTSSCFLLIEIGVGEVRRSPADACRTRITPASTFKVPHAIAALDAGVVSGPDEGLAWDGTGDWPPLARHDHTLATAIRYSVVWYFQQLARRLGPEREREYLQRLRFGNMDATSGLTTFWIGGSLQITAEEEADFWQRLYADRLPVSPRAMALVREMLIQPRGTVTNVLGSHPFAAPWPDDAVVSAKTGSATDRSGQAARWLVGHVARGARRFVFVSCVIGKPDLAPTAAIELAAQALRASHVL